ncbi:MAG: hypothetical protein WCG32_04010 [Actinomycetes bacterium]
MKRRLLSILDGAGFVNVTPIRAIGGTLIALALMSITLFGLTGSMGISCSVMLCLIAQGAEIISSRINKRIEGQSQEWPKFLDSIHSAVWAGSSLQDAIGESKNYAPKIFLGPIDDFEKDSAAGLSFQDCLDNLKSRLASPIGDRFVEMTRLAQLSGGRGYLSALRAQANQLRIENATWKEIQVKQNWVLSTAKMAVLAPWLVLLVLGSRKETAAAFETEAGITVLVIGLVASLLTFKLIKVLGKLPVRKRVLL